MSDVFDLLLRAILTNDETGYAEVLNLAQQQNMSKHQLYLALQKVEFWCRMKGLVPLQRNEEAALIKLQSLFRRWYVRKCLRDKLNLYKNLSTTDSAHYALIAHKYYRLVNKF